MTETLGLDFETGGFSIVVDMYFKHHVMMKKISKTKITQNKLINKIK
jgi:hypothetical protein